MYFPEGLGTQLDEKAIRGNPKEIVHKNTGFQGQDLLVVNQSAASKFDSAPCMLLRHVDASLHFKLLIVGTHPYYSYCYIY